MTGSMSSKKWKAVYSKQLWKWIPYCVKWFKQLTVMSLQRWKVGFTPYTYQMLEKLKGKNYTHLKKMCYMYTFNLMWKRMKLHCLLEIDGTCDHVKWKKSFSQPSTTFFFLWRSQGRKQCHEIKRGTTREIGRDKEKEGEPKERVTEGLVWSGALTAWKYHNETQYFKQLLYANKYGENYNHLNSNIKSCDKFRTKNG
jgi:hypothetical protein